MRVLRARRKTLGSRWRRLRPGEQARFVLAYLRINPPLADLAAGAGVSTSTMWRYVRETVDLLVAHAPALEAVVDVLPHPGWVCLGGTLISTWRTWQREYYSGRHQRHGANVQVLAAPGGRLLWASPVLPGSTCDLTAAEHHGIITALEQAEVTCLCDRGHIGGGGTVVHGRKRYRNHAPAERDEHRNQTIATLRSPTQRANATLKT